MSIVDESLYERMMRAFDAFKDINSSSGATRRFGESLGGVVPNFAGGLEAGLDPTRLSDPRFANQLPAQQDLGIEPRIGVPARFPSIPSVADLQQGAQAMQYGAQSLRNNGTFGTAADSIGANLPYSLSATPEPAIAPRSPALDPNRPLTPTSILPEPGQATPSRPVGLPVAQGITGSPRRVGIIPPSSLAPARPIYENYGLGRPFTDPVTVLPDPREDLQSEAGQAWLAKVNPENLNTPAGPAESTINTLRGGQSGVAAFYSPEQRADQMSRGINLVGGGPFEWNERNTAQLGDSIARRMSAASQAQYLREKGLSETGMAQAAIQGKLAMYDPERMATDRLLEAGRQNPMLWRMPEFKQKVGVPLTPEDKLSIQKEEHPGLDIPAGLEQIQAGYAPGTSRLRRMFDTSRFGIDMTPQQKIQAGISAIPPDQSAEWRRVAEVMGLIDPASGRQTK